MNEISEHIKSLSILKFVQMLREYVEKLIPLSGTEAFEEEKLSSILAACVYTSILITRITPEMVSVMLKAANEISTNILLKQAELSKQTEETVNDKPTPINMN